MNESETSDAYRVLVQRPKGKRPLERHTRRCEDNVKSDLKVIEWLGMYWINLKTYGASWQVLVECEN